jgi:hypothetical protein
MRQAIDFVGVTRLAEAGGSLAEVAEVEGLSH